MIRIVSSTDRAALERLIARRSRGDRAFDRQVRTIVERVRKEGERALLAFARRFDGIRPPLEIGVDEMIIGESEREDAVEVGLEGAAEVAEGVGELGSADALSDVSDQLTH